MIRPWKEIAKKNLEANEIIDLYHSTVMTEYYECMYTIKYMLDLGMEGEQLYKKFIKMLKKDELKYFVYVNHIPVWLQMAERCKWPKDNDTTFYITDNEIKRINQINAPRDFKLYILGVVCYAKWAKKKCGLALADNGTRSYAWYIATHEDVFSKGRMVYKTLDRYLIDPETNHGLKFRVSDTQRTSKGMNLQYTHLVIDSDWIEWDATSGRKITDLEKQVKRLSEKITSDVVTRISICPVCGKEFKRKEHSRTILCPECFEIDHRQRNTESKRREREKKKLDPI